MQLGSRKSKLVSELLNSDNCITGQYLANILGVTSRTIRGDIGEINAQLEGEGIRILSTAGQGYYVDKSDKGRLAKLVKTEKDYIVPILPDMRVEHILKQLVLYPKGISTETILQQIYVSKSTLERDLIKVSDRLSENKLRLTKKAENIISADGNELFIREMYNTFFLKAVKFHTLDKKILNNDVSQIFNKACEIVYGMADSSDVDLTGDEFDAIAVFFTVVIFRNINGFALTDYKENNPQSNKTVKGVLEKLNREVYLNTWEEKYITAYLEKLIFDYVHFDGKHEIDKLVQKGIDNISETYNYVFDDELKGKLLILLMKTPIKSSEYSLKDIKKEYPLAVEMAVSLVNFINHELLIDICDETLAKIVLLFVCEMEADLLSKEMKKRDVVIVCQSGDSTKNLIESRLKRHFPGFNILGFFPLYRIEQAIGLKPEIIISTVMAEIDDIPVIVINPLLKDYDVLKINTVIRQIEYRENISYEFINLFRENLFVKDIQVSDRYEAIKILSDTLKKNGYAQEDYYQAVIERENISSTAMGNMTAMPHAVGNNLGENVAAIGILKNPIEWNGEKVQLIFEINIKNATDGSLKQIFKSFFNLISSSRKVDRLINSKNYYEFIKTINK